MRKATVFFFAYLVAHSAFSQKELKPTDSFTISGEVENPVVIQSSDLKGVLLKDVLQSIEINAESPRVLSEYYFVCKAADGYTAVYSWNELLTHPRVTQATW